MKSKTILIICFLINLYFSRSGAFYFPSVCWQEQRSHIPKYAILDDEDYACTKIDGIPFVIERVGSVSPPKCFDEIAEMCIDVFFNADRGDNAPLWKKFQLAYLRGLQSADLRRRRTMPEARNAMFVAREVRVADSREVAKTKPLILDLDRIQNCNVNDTGDYVKGGIVGFVEVTERAYGLGNPYDNLPRRSHKKRSLSNMRPILTNLSVKAKARKSGIGSQLLEACEKAVSSWDDNTEIILEVEIDNPSASEFYKKRGYEELFTDPTCRRFNTNGLVLRKERCAKICMRKDLSKGTTNIERENGDKKSMNFPNFVLSYILK